MSNPQNLNYTKKNCQYLPKERFIMDYIYVDWKKVTNIEKKDNGKLFENVVDEFNSIWNKLEIENQS